jgi:hypothetical protein
VTARPDPSDYGDFDRPMHRATRFVGALLFLLLLAILTCAGCVRRGTVCLEASHGRVDPNWARQDNVGVSVCAEVAPPGE